MKKNSSLVIVSFLIIIVGVIYGVLLLTKYNIIFKESNNKKIEVNKTDVTDKDKFINDLNEYTEFALNRYNEDMAIGNNGICYTISFYDNLMHKDDSKYEGRIIYAINKIDDKYEVVDQRVYFTNKDVMLVNINVLDKDIDLKDNIKKYSSDLWEQYGYGLCDEYNSSLDTLTE